LWLNDRSFYFGNVSDEKNELLEEKTSCLIGKIKPIIIGENERPFCKKKRAVMEKQSVIEKTNGVIKPRENE